MKIVLSRKGFDSHAGGGPSPILPDGRLLSLPIPEPSRNPCPRLRYEELRWGALDRTYLDLIRELRLPIPEASAGAHLDPDLDAHTLPRAAGWRPAFGQAGAAQTHLDNQAVGVGDVFLFFGLFRQTLEHNGALHWARPSPRVHAIFGYLEVGEVVRIASADDAERLVTRLPWIAQHPHVWDWSRKSNTLYVSADRSTLVPGRPGAGLLRWSSSVRLSKPGAGPSIWQLPFCFTPTEASVLTYHHRPSRWTSEPDGSTTLRTVGRGQEFVIEADNALRAWTEAIIKQDGPHDE